MSKIEIQNAKRKIHNSNSNLPLLALQRLATALTDKHRWISTTFT
jgi:hypothetical protein